MEGARSGAQGEGAERFGDELREFLRGEKLTRPLGRDSSESVPEAGKSGVVMYEPD
jgi:hypothetical protein